MSGYATYQMVRANVDPSHKILLRDVLAIEELVEIDHRLSWEVHVPHGAGRGLGFLSAGNCKVVTGPVSVVLQTLRSDDGLNSIRHELRRRKCMSQLLTL